MLDLIRVPQKTYPIYGGPCDGIFLPWHSRDYEPPASWLVLPYFPENLPPLNKIEAFPFKIRVKHQGHNRHLVTLRNEQGDYEQAYIFAIPGLTAEHLAERWLFDIFGLVERDGAYRRINEWHY